MKSLQQFKELTSSGLSVIKFTASWCGPCVRIAPKFAEFAEKQFNPPCNFLIVDIDEAQEGDMKELTNKVRSVPTFQFMKNGEVVDTLIGANMTNLCHKIGSFTIADEGEGKRKIQNFLIFLLLLK